MHIAKIAYCDTDYLSRETIKILLKKIPSVEIVGEYNNSEDLIEKLKRKTPTIIIYNLQTGNFRDIIAIKNMQLKNPKVKIIVTSSFEDFKTIALAFSAGAIGFLSKKNLSVKDLSNAIDYSKENNHYLSGKCENKIKDINKMIQLNYATN